MTSRPLRHDPNAPARHPSWAAALMSGAAAVAWALRQGRRLINDRRDIRQLAELDDHRLEDIGLTRGQVLGALSEPVHRAPTQVLVQVTRREREGAPRIA